MKDKKPTELSNEELIKEEKKINAVTIAFASILIISFAAILFLTIKKGFSALIVVPLGLFPLLIVCINKMKELKKEIKSRNL